jgi:hypothetical protein
LPLYFITITHTKSLRYLSITTICQSNRGYLPVFNFDRLRLVCI